MFSSSDDPGEPNITTASSELVSLNKEKCIYISYKWQYEDPAMITSFKATVHANGEIHNLSSTNSDRAGSCIVHSEMAQEYHNIMVNVTAINLCNKSNSMVMNASVKDEKPCKSAYIHAYNIG